MSSGRRARSLVYTMLRGNHGIPYRLQITGAKYHPVFSSPRQSTEYDNNTDRSYLSLSAEAHSLNGQAMASRSIVSEFGPFVDLARFFKSHQVFSHFRNAFIHLILRGKL